MDSAMGESVDGNIEVSDSSGPKPTARVNGEVNGLGEDTVEQSVSLVKSLKSVFSAAKSANAAGDGAEDVSVSSIENGDVKVPNKDCVKSSLSGTKVPTNIEVTKMEVDLGDSDSDESVSAIEATDPLDSSVRLNSSADSLSIENVSGELNSPEKLESNGRPNDNNRGKPKNNSNGANHKIKDGVKENGGSVRVRSPDIEEISNDSIKSGKGDESHDKVHDSDTDAMKDGDSRDSSSKSGTPAKVKKSRKSVPDANLTPRRSSRNMSRVQKSYIEQKDEPDPVEPEEEEESDVEEIAMVDPLADSKPIIVKDTRKLVEIAAGARTMKGGGKKEPTLVIIDTNSILAGRGPIPMAHQSHRPSPMPSTSRSTQGYTILPVGLSAHQIPYPKARITPYPQSYPRPQPIHHVPVPKPQPVHVPTPKPQPPPPPPPPQILPTLTDDMYVVEAPSFIVPYVYEKPPLKPLKDYIEKLRAEIERLTKLEEEEEEKTKKEEEDEKTKKDEEKEKTKKEGEEEKTKKDAEAKQEVDDEKQVNETLKEDSSNLDSSKSVADSLKETISEKTESTTEGNVKSGQEEAIKDKDDKSEGEDNLKVDADDKKKEDLDPLKKEDLTKDVASKDDSNNETKNQSNKESSESITVVDSNKPATTDDTSSDKDKDKTDEDKPKTLTYFDNPLGKFFMQIGTNLVTEHVQTDLLRHQRRKRDREGKISASAQFAVNALLNNLELSKENNKPFHLPIKKCEYCSFKTESALVMAQHLETPHMRNYVYRCNYCPLEVRSPHDILYHMEAEHNVRGRLERAPGFHQCPSCPFEDNQKGKLTRHLLSCAKKFKQEKNLEPPIDWEPPAKIPRVSRNRPASIGLGTAAYQAMIAKQGPQHPLLPKLIPSPGLTSPGSIRGRGRPTMQARFMPDMKITAQNQRPIIQASQMRQGMLYRPSGSGSQPQVLLPTTYQMGNQLFHVVGSQGQTQMLPVGSSSRLSLMPQGSGAGGPTPVALVPNLTSGATSISIQQGPTNNKHTTSKMPSISITPLPRQPVVNSSPAQNRSQGGQAGVPGKTYVICEICDGYIKDLEQLRNHMLWIHKVKIHPKMIHNRPPLNCQKCQCRFFTDQGLERHLLGTHGLVTSSMQEAANKGKDAGRCPACGRVYQWKLLNHVARDHGMVLKPAHLSYKCTVCTATFGMYKQFENHVYSAHSTQAKRVMDKKPSSSSSTSSASQVYRSQPNDAGTKSLLKPLKMNDEITIIPQPARTRPGPASRTGKPTLKLYTCQVCNTSFEGPTAFSQYTSHIRKTHLQRVAVKLCRLDSCPPCVDKHVTPEMLEFLDDHKKGVDVIELSDDEVVIANQGRNEITITKLSSPPGPRRFKQRMQKSRNVQLIDIDDSPVKNSKENGEDSLIAVKERLRRRKSLEISQVDSEVTTPEPGPSKKRRRHNE